jgi:hypothetical protein
VRPEYANIVVIPGPLHVSLNSRETLVLKHWDFFHELFCFLFSSSDKVFPKKPQPWRIEMLISVCVRAWIHPDYGIRKIVMEKFGNSRDLDYRTHLHLLDTEIPSVYKIYDVSLKKGTVDEYFANLFRVLLQFTDWNRKNYNKAPLILLSDLLYWQQTRHPAGEAFAEALRAIHEYYVENLHSRVRGRTTPQSSPEDIQQTAQLITTGSLHRKATAQFLHHRAHRTSVKSYELMSKRAAQFLLEKFGFIY